MQQHMCVCVRARVCVAQVLLDLLLLAEADGHILHLASNLSRLAFALAISRHKVSFFCFSFTSHLFYLKHIFYMYFTCILLFFPSTFPHCPLVVLLFFFLLFLRFLHDASGLA